MEKSEFEQDYKSMVRKLFKIRLMELGLAATSDFYDLSARVSPCATCILKTVEFSPKPGDLVTVISPRGKSMFLYKSGDCKRGGDSNGFAVLHRDGGFLSGLGIWDKFNDTDDWHLSTKSERCEFIDAMVKAGYRWNAKKLKLSKVESGFKIGDFVYWSGNNPRPAIILRHCHSFSDSWVLCGINNLDGNNSSASEKHLRLATETEKRQLIDLLHSTGKDWDAVNKEIVELKFAPRDGDFILTDRGFLAIFKGNKVPSTGNEFEFYYHSMLYDLGSTVQLDDWCAAKPSRIMTDGEKQIFTNKLAEKGKNWNPETKRIEPIKWRAEKGGIYWQSFCNANNGDTEYRPHASTENRDPFDNAIYTQGDYHKTEEDCQRFCNALNLTIKNFK